MHVIKKLLGLLQLILSCIVCRGRFCRDYCLDECMSEWIWQHPAVGFGHNSSAVLVQQPALADVVRWLCVAFLATSRFVALVN